MTCRTLCAAVVLILVASTFPVVAYGQGIQIETAPQVVREAIRQGEINTCQIEVTNTGAVPVKVVAEVVDLAIDEYGYNVEVPERAGYVWGLQEMTKVSPEEFLLNPGETRIAEVTIDAPKPLSGGRYGIVYFAASDKSAKGRIIMVVRCGSLLFATVPGTEMYSGRVKDIRLIQSEDSRPGYFGGFDVIFENTGNVHVSATGQIEVSNGKSTVLKTALRGGTGTVLPGGTRVYRAELGEAIPDGDYQVTVEFEFEGNRVSEQKVLSVKGRQAYLE